MNNLVFNTSPDQLKVSVYGKDSLDISRELRVTDDGTIEVQVTNTSSITVEGSVEVTNTVAIPVDVTDTVGVTGSVEVTNTVAIPVDVTDTVAVTGSVEVTNTVAIPVDVTDTVGVTGSVEVTNTAAVLVTNTNIEVTNAFVTDTEADVTISAPTIMLAQTDISLYRDASFFVYNTSNTTTGTTAAVQLQISPIEASGYMSDPKVVAVDVGPGESTVIDVGTYAHYAQLSVSSSGTTAVLSAYLNARG